jgi:hypothetical protein
MSVMAQLPKQSSSEPAEAAAAAAAAAKTTHPFGALVSFPIPVISPDGGRTEVSVSPPRTIAGYDPKELLHAQTVLVFGPRYSGKKSVITKFVTTLYEDHLDFVSIYGVVKPIASHWFHPYVATRTAAFSINEMREEISKSKSANYFGIIILDSGVFNDSTRQSLPELCREANEAGLTVIIKMNDVNDVEALNVDIHTIAFTHCVWTLFRSAVHKKFLGNMLYNDFQDAHIVAAGLKGTALVISGQSWPAMKHFHSDRLRNESFNF